MVKIDYQLPHKIDLQNALPLMPDGFDDDAGLVSIRGQNFFEERVVHP